MIQDHTIDQTLIELARTMKALKALRAARKAASYDWDGRKYINAEALCRRECSAEHATATRASMDLTRKLADLRQGR
jgi:hypothetical protein